MWYLFGFILGIIVNQAYTMFIKGVYYKKGFDDGWEGKHKLNSVISSIKMSSYVDSKKR